MRIGPRVVTSLALVCWVAGAGAGESGPPAVASDAMRAGDPPYDWRDTPDYTALRTDIGWRENYNDLCESGRPVKRMGEAMNEQQWSHAEELGGKWLHRCPVDLGVHYYMGVVLSELGRHEQAEDHFRWTRGLMDSIVASGDGEQCETAYVTISVAEEYDALFLFGLRPKGQATVRGDGVLCDQITAENEDGEQVIIYFNPAAHFHRLVQFATDAAGKIREKSEPADGK